MRTVSIPIEGLTVDRLLQEAAGSDVVFLTAQGQVRFALMPAAEEDQEILALRSNPSFMDYLTPCEQRAQTRPRKSLQEIRELYGPQT